MSTDLENSTYTHSPSDFEYTQEMAVFDLLGINLYHGWVIDPTDDRLVSAIGSKSYNQVVENIIQASTLRNPHNGMPDPELKKLTPAEQEKLMRDGVTYCYLCM